MPTKPTTISPEQLSQYLGQKYAPTEQQAAVTGFTGGSLLVVAGAGAGKTETMAARVVWLVANGLMTPDQILGLTFTKKAAQELRQRIRRRLRTLASVPPGTIAVDERILTSLVPTTSTYDAFVVSLISEFGLLLPVEPSARLISKAELCAITGEIVQQVTQRIPFDRARSTVIDDAIAIFEKIDSSLGDVSSVEAESQRLRSFVEGLAGSNAKTNTAVATQEYRLWLLGIVERLRQRLVDHNLVTFGMRTAQAARLVRDYPQVAQAIRTRYPMVMLDEYQDTSTAQRILLRTLFADTSHCDAEPAAVTAVGDPMQAIYGWRGAGSSNLELFAEDFARDGVPATTLELTTSWRNPQRVLAAGNVLASKLLDRPGKDRLVSELEAQDNAPAGDVRFAWFDHDDEQIQWVADRLAEKFAAANEDRTPFTGAILVRKNRHALPYAQALRERGIPYEVISLMGLLSVPEVADAVAFARMLVRPDDAQAALRILTGPHIGLGTRDLQALQRRVRELNRAQLANPADQGEQDAVESDADEHPGLVKLRSIIDELSDPTAERLRASLTDAIADLGPADRYTPEGFARLTFLSQELRYLRTYSLQHSLTDLFNDIIEVTGLRTEVLAREDPHADGAQGTVQLDRLLEVVEDYAAIPGATLEGMLQYFDIAQQEEGGLEKGAVEVRSDRVQILTVHKAKGLEWQHVAVVHADASTYRPTAKAWTKHASALPPEALTGEEDAPTIELYTDEGEITKASEFTKAQESLEKALKQVDAAEQMRLFYVAVTRASESLLVSGAGRRDAASTAKATAPYEGFGLLKQAFPDLVELWHDPEAPAPREKAATPPTQPNQDGQAVFPFLAPAAGQEEGAKLVRRYMDGDRAEQREASTRTKQFDLAALWEVEVSALIEEHEAAQRGQIVVEMPTELTATDMVNLRKDPAEFARRVRRPVPFKPNLFAKRGTSFHAWLEERFERPTLLDESELPGAEEEAVLGQAELDELKEKFLASRWAELRPTHVEEPFTVSLGGYHVRGRMDAVFQQPDGTWVIVDWKTGRRPTGRDLAAAELQLQVYAAAWRALRIQAGESDPQVKALFFYVRENSELEMTRLLSREELAALLDSEPR